MKKLSILMFGLLVSTSLLAYGPNTHYHGDAGRVYNPGYGYYNGGGYYYGYGYPNVVITIPAPRPYPRVCEEVEVCDNYTGECWLDRYCR